MREVERYLSRISDDNQKRLMNMTHEMIMTHVPQCTCSFKWNVPFYRYIKPLCYLNRYDNFFYVGFLDGIELHKMGLLDLIDTKTVGKFYIRNDLIDVKEQFLKILFAAVALQESKSL